ncbi:MAG: hypothetical protein K2L73_02245 [Muribaculaceae bacterium]|nr:hypothetical protein [Muribaculaceae bacterium]
MRFLIFLSLLLLLLSCRSHKELLVESVDDVRVERLIQNDRDSVSLIFDLLRSSSDILLSGLTIDFFPPDSLHPDIRAVPKSIHIDSARVNELSERATAAAANVSDKGTENLKSDSSSSKKENQRSDVRAFSPSGWTIFLLTVAAILIAGVFVYLKFFRNH